MRVLALAPAPKNGFKVKIYSYDYIDVPMESVIKNSIVDSCRPNSGENNDIETMIISTKENSVTIRGVIFYEKLPDLVDFFLNHYKPVNNLEIDHLLKDARGLSRKKVKNFLMETIIRQRMESENTRRRKRVFYPYFNMQSFISSQVSREYEYLREKNNIIWETAAGVAFLKQAVHKRMLYVDEEAGEIVKRKFLMFIDHTNLFFYWDGEKTRSYFPETIDSVVLSNLIGEKTYELFENHARVMKVDREYFPHPDFKPEFLLKVPSRAKASEFPMKKIIYSKQRKIFSGSLMLYDARSAINLNNGLKIIDSIDIAAKVLSRAPQWVYVPGDFPVAETFKKYLEEKEYYIACGGLNGRI